MTVSDSAAGELASEATASSTAAGAGLVEVSTPEMHQVLARFSTATATTLDGTPNSSSSVTFIDETDMPISPIGEAPSTSPRSVIEY